MILFENAHFIAVDKPAGWLSVAGRQVSPTPCLLHRLSERLGAQVWPTHRLDRAVSGVMLYAKSPGAHRSASLWFEQRLIEKDYEALTDPGSCPSTEQRFHWENPLVRGKKRAYERPFGKIAVTDAEFIGTQTVLTQTAAYWRLKPRTGRSHQLRYHLAHAGFPIWGDALYGSSHPIPAADAIALRAIRLTFLDPSHASFGLPPQIDGVSILDWMESLK